MTRSKRVTFLARVAVLPLAALTLAGYGVVAGAAGAPPSVSVIRGP